MLVTRNAGSCWKVLGFGDFVSTRLHRRRLFDTASLCRSFLVCVSSWMVARVMLTLCVASYGVVVIQKVRWPMEEFLFNLE